MNRPLPAMAPAWRPLSGSRRRWHWALAAGAVVVAFAAASFFDLAERWQSVSRAWEAIEVDELPLVLLALAILAAGRMRRRSRQAAFELAQSRRREDELRRAAELEERLAQVQKAESMGIFAGGLAHDLANLLLAIEAFAGRLEGGVPERLEGSVGGIRDATRRGRDLVGKLKELAEPQPIRAAALDLNHHLESLREILTSLLPEGIDLQVETEAELPSVAGEPGAVTQILINLVANARDAMPGGGTIRVSTCRALRAEGAWARIRVSDSGSGMTAATVAHAFDPFFTTKPLGRGSGLGLTMVRVLVTQLGGMAEITSHPGTGTDCDVYLALWQEASPRVNYVGKPRDGANPVP